MLRFACPHCRTALSAPESAMGHTSHCRKCGGAVTVPLALAATEPRKSAPSRGPSWLAVLFWLVLLVGTPVGALVAWGLVFYGNSHSAGEPPNIYGLVEQARNLLLCAVLMLAAYIVARAIDRLTQ